MGKDYYRRGKTRHKIPELSSLPNQDPARKSTLQAILGDDILDELNVRQIFNHVKFFSCSLVLFSHAFQRAFDKASMKHDAGGETKGGDNKNAEETKSGGRKGDNDFLTLDEIITACMNMGADVSIGEVRAWLKIADIRDSQEISFVDFVLAYANLIYAPLSDDITGDSPGKSLRLDGEWSDLGTFARSFGKKQLREIEIAFDTMAQKDQYGVLRLRAGDILGTFPLHGAG